MKKKYYEIKEKIQKNIILNRVINAFGFTVIGAVISRIILLITNVFISRMIGQTEYGKYSLINNTINTFVLFAGMGIGATLVRYIAICKNDQKTKTGLFIKTFAIINVILALLLFVVVFFLSDYISFWVSENYELGNYFKIASIVMFLFSISSFWESVLQGFEKFKTNSIINIIFAIVGLLSMIVLTYFYGIEGALFGLIVAYLIKYIFLKYRSSKTIKEEEIILSFKMDKNISEAFLNYGLPLFLASIIVSPVLLFLNAHLAKYEGFDQLAVLSVAVQWATIITYIPSKLGSLKPIYAELWEKNEIKKFINLFKKASFAAAIMGLLTSVPIMLFSKLILSFYGKTYVEGFNIFIVFIISTIFISIQLHLGVFFQSVGKMWIGLILNLIWAINLIGLYFLLTKYGALGYSIAYTAAYFIHCIISWGATLLIIKKRKERLDEPNSKQTNIN